MNNNAIYTTIVSKNKINGVRQQDDFYATSPEAVMKLLDVRKFSKNIWECACGKGHISNVLIEGGAQCIKYRLSI